MTASTTALAAEVAGYVKSQAQVPLPLVDIAVDDLSGAAVIRGRVLTSGQAAALQKIAHDHNCGLDIQVVADPASRLEQGWVALAAAELELWRDPAVMGQDRRRQTVYVVGDGHLRLLGRLPAALLVQGPDLTVGWIDAALVEAADPEPSRADWERRVRAVPGRAVDPDPAIPGPPSQMAELLLGSARETLGTPYRWGGTTPSGYDCSGLVQRLLSQETGVLLPKHSGDQRHVGARPADAERRAGDLLFATPIGQKVGHVMLVTSPTTVLHACRTEQRVIEESIDDNGRRYQHQGYRRPVELS